MAVSMNRSMTMETRAAMKGRDMNRSMTVETRRV